MSSHRTFYIGGKCNPGFGQRGELVSHSWVGRALRKPNALKCTLAAFLVSHGSLTVINVTVVLTPLGSVGFLRRGSGAQIPGGNPKPGPRAGQFYVAYGMAPQPHGSRAYAGKKKSFIRPRFAALATSALNRERRFEARAKTEERRTKRGSLAKCRASLFVFSPTLLASLVVCRLPSGGLWLSSLLHTVVID